MWPSALRESSYNLDCLSSVQFSRLVWLFATPRTAACQASLSITNSRSLLKLMSIALVMPSNHLILCCPLLLLPSIFPSIRVFSSESALCIRRPKNWSFGFSINPSNGLSKRTIMLALIRPIYSDFWEYFTILETVWPWFLSFFSCKQHLFLILKVEKCYWWVLYHLSHQDLSLFINLGYVEICSDSKVTPCIPPA